MFYIFKANEEKQQKWYKIYKYNQIYENLKNTVIPPQKCHILS